MLVVLTVTRTGLGCYLSDPWNVIEIVSYILFMISFSIKVMMQLEANELYKTLPAVLEGGYDAPSECFHVFQFANSPCDFQRIGLTNVMTNALVPGPLIADLDLERYATLQELYMYILAPNCILMWLKLFKVPPALPHFCRHRYTVTTVTTPSALVSPPSS